MSSIRSAGFGLIELLVALAILVIVALLSMPAVERFMSAGRLEAALQEVTAALNLARTTALSTGQPVRVSIHSGQVWCVAAGTQCTCDGDCDCKGCEASIVRSIDHEKVRIDTSLKEYQVDPANGIVTQTGVISMTAGSVSGALAINKLGKAWLCKKETEC